MKNRLIISCFTALLFFCGCDNSDKEVDGGGSSANLLQLSRETLNMENTDASGAIVVTSNGDWNVKVESTGDWLSASPLSGSGDGPIRVFATDNTEGTRSGTITVSQTYNSSTVSHQVRVSQLGADPDILLEYTTEVISYEGAVVTVEVTSNVDWEVIIDEQYDWISETDETPSRAYEKETRNFKLEPNYDFERTGKVSFRAVSEYILSKTAEFTQQAANASLSISQDEFVVPFICEGLSVPIDIEGFAQKLSVDSPVDWIEWDEDATTATEVILNLVENNSDFPREAEITINNLNLNETVKIFQYGKPNPRIGDDESVGPLAFPGAEGGGRFTTGGRSGTVYHVTTLADYDRNETPIEGSLRYGIDHVQGPRTIVFDVGGYIDLKRGIQIYRGDLSIIGQTAPGDGITIRYSDVTLMHSDAANNTIIRFLRVRSGDHLVPADWTREVGYEVDAVTGRYFQNGIIDHVTGTWSIDECMSFYGVKNFTMQWCIAGEPLCNSYHEKGSHGYAMMFAGDNASAHHNLILHAGSRAPRASTLSDPADRGAHDYVGYSDMRNNVVYNWYGNGDGAYGGGGGNTFNWINNTLKPGPATIDKGWKQTRIFAPDNTAYIHASGNLLTTYPESETDNWGTYPGYPVYSIWNHTSEPHIMDMKVQEPHPFPKVTTHSASGAFEVVAKYAGASLRRDAHDIRYERELRAGSAEYQGSYSDAGWSPVYGLIDKPSDVGGYPILKSQPAWPDTDGDGIPDIWEIAYGLNPNDPSDAAAFTLDSRYSNLEVYFHNLVQHIVAAQNEGGTPMEKN